jgi:hypothetical protein
MALEIFQTRDGSEIAVVAATWDINRKISFESLAHEFRSNPVLAWRNYGSVVSSSIDAAIKEPSAVLNRVNTTRAPSWDEVRMKYHEWFLPRRGRRYFMHFDLSKNRDKTGVAVVHLEGPGRVEVDFMRAIAAPPGGDINFAKLREEYIYPLGARGFHIECISYDGFQSEETRQVLEEKGYHTDYCSADKNKEPYDTLIGTLLHDQLDFYSYPVFTKELEELKLINGLRYDHPKKFKDGSVGSKDVADAVACASYMALRYARENPAEAPGVLRVHRNPSMQFSRDPWG